MPASPTRRLPLVLALLAALTAACAKPAQTPHPGGTPASDQAGATLVVGTAADYPPFAYYDDQHQLSGFDVAKIRAVGDKLGLKVEVKDFAFDNLAAALASGQIDAAIAALSVTPARAAQVDFTDVYYASEDAVIGRPDLSLGQVRSLDDLAGQRIGVQRDSVYQKRVTTELVDTGKLRPGNLLVYGSADEGYQAVRAGQVDVMLLDYLPAQAYVKHGGVKLIAYGLAPQNLAIAVKQGNTALRDKLNQALAQVKADPTLTAAAQKYLLDPAAVFPTPGPAQPTPAGLTTPTPPACLDGMAVVQDLTLDDQNLTAPDAVAPGASFVKAWRVQNTGTCVWDGSYGMVFDQGEQMDGQPVPFDGTVAAGATADVQLRLTAPSAPGTYLGTWQMTNGEGIAFGERLVVEITVPAQPTATPVPSPTPGPAITFTAAPMTVTAGQQVTFNWSAPTAQSVFFSPQGAPWVQYPAPVTGSRVAWPNQTTTYELRAIMPDGTMQLQSLTIQVTPAPSAPQITKFTVTPAPTVTLGACVDAAWVVNGQLDAVKVYRGDTLFFQGTQARGKAHDCPPMAGPVTYRIEASGPNGTSIQSRDLTVVNPAAAPTATPAPGATPVTGPHVDQFNVDPATLPAGACFTLTWHVSGDGGVRVRVRRGTSTILDYAPMSGTMQDCPIYPGQVAYQLEAVNSAGQSDFSQDVVTVTGP
jgi:ABC-type amino acid transport substrate-binding protein